MASVGIVLALAGANSAGQESKRDGMDHLQGPRVESYEGKSLNEWMASLGHRDPQIRGDACYALAAFGPRAKPALPALIRALRDQDGWVRWTAAHAIGAIGPEAVAAVPALTKALQDHDESVRRHVACSLGHIGPEAKSAVPALIWLLDDEVFDVRAYAAVALGDIGREPNCAVPALASALKKEKTPCRRFGSMAFYSNRDVHLATLSQNGGSQSSRGWTLRVAVCVCAHERNAIH
jgi:hypothetical protein